MHALRRERDSVGSELQRVQGAYEASRTEANARQEDLQRVQLRVAELEGAAQMAAQMQRGGGSGLDLACLLGQMDAELAVLEDELVGREVASGGLKARMAAAKAALSARLAEAAAQLNAVREAHAAAQRQLTARDQEIAALQQQVCVCVCACVCVLGCCSSTR